MCYSQTYKSLDKKKREKIFSKMGGKYGSRSFCRVLIRAVQNMKTNFADGIVQIFAIKPAGSHSMTREDILTTPLSILVLEYWFSGNNFRVTITVCE